MAGTQSIKGRPVNATTAGWIVDDQTARLGCASLSAQLNVDQPADGLHNLVLGDDVRLDARLLGIATAGGVVAQPADTYVRGADFVSTQSGTNEFPFRTQAYWSAAALSDGVVAATLTLSLQTNLLDTRPEIAVVSQFGPTALAPPRVSPTACVGSTSAGVTIAIVPHPTDAVDARGEVDGAEHRLWLRPPFLEKGVIRRFRIAALLFTGDDTEAKLERAIGEFADLPAPLTT